eukprot:gene30746-40036_t
MENFLRPLPSIITSGEIDMEEKLETMSKFQLRDMIDELEHQLEHLEKSQAYLMEALAESPEDSDFKEAFVENCGAIERRRGSIRESKLLLQMVDPVYFAEHYRSQLQEQQVQPVQLPQQAYDSGNDTSLVMNTSIVTITTAAEIEDNATPFPPPAGSLPQLPGILPHYEFIRQYLFLLKGKSRFDKSLPKEDVKGHRRYWLFVRLSMYTMNQRGYSIVARGLYVVQLYERSAFLGLLGALRQLDLTPRNTQSNRYSADMSDSARKKLQLFYKPFNERLFQLRTTLIHKQHR